MQLNLHSGGEEVSYDILKQLPVPTATATHHPVPHHRIVDALKHTLTFYGHEVVEEHHAIDKAGARYFGLLSLKSNYGLYEDTVGLRNSHDKTFPVGIAFGGRVFVCSNLSFYGDHVIKRKHTANAWRDVHGLLAEIIEPLAGQREAQFKTFETYKAKVLTEQLADHIVLELYRNHVLNVQRIPEVLHHWAKPSHDFGDRTAWRMFNAVTGVLAGRVAENPGITKTLHRVIDSVCTTVH